MQQKKKGGKTETSLHERISFSFSTKALQFGHSPIAPFIVAFWSFSDGVFQEAHWGRKSIQNRVDFIVNAETILDNAWD